MRSLGVLLMMVTIAASLGCGRSKPSPSAEPRPSQTSRSSSALDSPPAANPSRANAVLPTSIASVHMMRRADIIKSRLHQRIQPLGRQ